MKNVLLNALMILTLGCTVQLGYAQDAVNLDETAVKEKSAKEQLIQKYEWVKAHLNNKTQPVHHLAEMRFERDVYFVMIETADGKVVYDNNGNRHCTDSPELNCINFYKLREGELSWSASK